MQEHSFWFYVLTFFSIILLRYLAMAGFAHWLLYQRQPAKVSILNDIHLSVLSTGVFAIATAVIMTLYDQGMTKLHGQIDADTWWTLPLSYLAVLVLQDAYFYATHRLFHHPRLFPWFHQGHHRSRQPTPWTSFAFDPLEAIVQALFLIGVVMLIPLHVVTLLAVLTTMTVWAVVNHLGLEVLPLRFPHHWLGRWVIGPAHHSIHHRRHGKHFGLYFTLWDWVFGSEDPAYGASLQPAAVVRPGA